jgi:hypothetical protein
VIGVAIDADSFSVNGALAGSFGAGEGSGGVGGVDILFVQDFESAALGDFTQTGLVLSSVDPLKGAISANLVHDDTVNQSFKQIIAVDEKFRNRNITLKLNIKSAASAGNVTLTVVDETNAVTLVNSEQLPVSNDVGGAIGQVSFDMPDDCLSFSYEVVALPEAGSPVTIVDDVIAEITSLIDEQSVLVQEADSYLIASGNSGGSATANVTDIPFNNVIRNVGSDIQFNTTSVTILTDGVYDFSVLVNITATTAVMGIYKNGTILAGMSPSANSNTKAGSYSGYFEAGDVVSFRLSTTSTLQNSSTDHVLSVTKQGSLKQVNPNPNSKITIPTSELRMEGASTRGSTATAIVRFDNIAKIRGDAFEVLSDAALGTRIVMKKKGKLDVSTSIQPGTRSNRAGISKNQSVLTSVPTLASEYIACDSQKADGRTINIAGSVSVEVGDVIRVFSQTGIVADVAHNLNLHFQEQDISVSVTNTLPQFSESDSSVRVDTANGYGSTGTRIRRFSNVRDNIGNDIEYVPSAVNGDSFVVKSAGIYNISYTELYNATATSIGITLNSPNLTTDVATLQTNPNNEVLAADTSSNVTNTSLCANWQGFLPQGSVLRAHTNGITPASNNGAKFTISKVGKPNVTGVDVTPFVNIPQPTTTEWVDAGPIQITATTTAPTKGTTSVDNVRWRRVGQDYECEYEYRHSASGAAGSGNYLISLPAGIEFHPSTPLTTSLVTGTWSGQYDFTQFSRDSYVRMNSNTGNGDGFVVPYSATQFRLGVSSLYGSNNSWNSSYYSLGQTIISLKVYLKFRGKGLTATNPNILTAPESFSTDIASLTYAPSSLYTLANLDTAPVGTFITFTYAAGGNVRTQTTTAPTQSTSDMNVNGIRLFARDHALASTADEPAAIAIQIGKGKKGRSLDLYKNVAKAIGGELESLTDGALVTYSEVSGVLLVDVGYRGDTSSTPAFVFEDVSTQASGYLVINASKSPALTGVPLVQSRIATLSDEKVNNTAATGKNVTAGVWTTQVVNTIVDPSGIVSNLNSNQITLSPGVYHFSIFNNFNYNIAASTIFRTRFRNITDGITSLVGIQDRRANTQSQGATNDGVNIVNGLLTLTSEKTFEVQLRASNTVGTSAASNFGEVETYLQMSIQKIK